jgi:hypothetical protein
MAATSTITRAARVDPSSCGACIARWKSDGAAPVPLSRKQISDPFFREALRQFGSRMTTLAPNGAASLAKASQNPSTHNDALMPGLSPANPPSVEI